MTLDSFLPARWRLTGDRAAAIAGVLDTPPIVPRQDGLVLFSAVGTATLLSCLVAVKSLWRELGRGRIALLDDGTLTAQDRGLLAHHCGDPQLLRADLVPAGPFPRGNGWEPFLASLDGRQKDYWLQVDSGTVTTGPVPAIVDAIGRNRSFILLEPLGTGPEALEAFAHRHYPDGPAEGDIRSRIESRLGTLEARTGWKYARMSAAIAGFSALGAGRPLAAAFLADVERLVGADVRLPGTAQVAADFQLANEPQPVVLAEDTAIAPFAAGEAYIDACRRAIERLRA